MREGDVTFAFAFDELTIVQLSARLPMVSARFGGTKPRPEMRREGIEVTAQSIGAGCGDASGQQAELEIVNKGECVVFGATTKMERRNGFADRVESQPEPSSGRCCADAGVGFVHLHEREHEVAKEEAYGRRSVLERRVRNCTPLWQ